MQKELITELAALQKKLAAVGTPAATKAAVKCGSAAQILDEEWTEPKAKEKAADKPATTKAT